MFKSITWSTFFTVIAVLGIFWYIVVALLYYRKEIFNLLNGKVKIPLKKKVTEPPAEVDDEIDDPAYDENILDELDELVTDIRHRILEEAGKTANKPELTEQLKARLANYGGLRQPAFRIALNNFLIQYAESICGVEYEEEELEALWNTLLH